MTRSVPATDPEDLWGVRASFVATGDSSCRKREPSPLHRDVDPRRSGQTFRGERTGVCFWIRKSQRAVFGCGGRCMFFPESHCWKGRGSEEEACTYRRRGMYLLLALLVGMY